MNNAIITHAFWLFVLSAIVGSPASESARITSYAYNADNQITQVDGPRTDVSDLTSHTYHTDGTLATATNALGHVTTFSNYNQYRLPTVVVDPNGSTTTLSYDGEGRVESILLNGATPSDERLVQYTYDSLGQLIRVDYNGGVASTGTSISYEYDNVRGLTAIEDDAGNRIEFTLDDGGSRTGEVIKAVGGSIERTLSRGFDQLGRVKQATNAAANVAYYSYDAGDNMIEAINPRNFATQRSYDALGRVTTVHDAQSATTHFTYDNQNNLTSITDQRGLTTTYSYNAFGDLTQIDSPDTGITAFTHDEAGNVISRTDARGVVTQYQYDALNRLVAETYPANPGQNISYAYDDATNGNYGIGRLTSIQGSLGAAHYRYDFAGNLVDTTYQIVADSFAISYVYDSLDGLIQITYPGGRVLDIVRNGQGQITGMTTKGADGITETVVSGATYLPFGPLEDLTYGNGLVLDRTFDQDYRLAQLTVIPWIDKSYTYDANGNITSIQDAYSPVASTFGYDAVDRLTTEVSDLGGPLSQSYQYDLVGNRTQKQSSSATQLLTYATDSNRLQTVDGETIVYDATGNVDARYIDGTLYEYVHGDEERYEQVYRDTQLLAAYQYNALGQRVSKTLYASSGQIQGKELYHYSQNGQLIATTVQDNAGTTNEIVHYIWLNTLPVAQITDTYDSTGNMTGSQILYLHPDHLHTSRIATNAAQSKVWEWYSDAFGAGAADQDPDGDSSLSQVALRFPGQYFDSETGLHYNYFRDYDPSLGRYIESDPIGLRGGMNTYLYALGNPKTLADPFGLWAINIDLYRGLGGGITIGRHNSTGEWFGGGRLGIGLGGGIDLDILENGPTARPLRATPYSDPCESIEPASSGTSVGTFAAIGADLATYGIGYGGEAGYHFDGTGAFYSEGPGLNPGFNVFGGSPIGGPGASVGGAFGIQILGW